MEHFWLVRNGMGFHTIRFSGYMEWISDIWNSVEAVDDSVEAVDAVGGLVDAIEAAGGISRAVVGPYGSRDGRPHVSSVNKGLAF